MTLGEYRERLRKVFLFHHELVEKDFLEAPGPIPESIRRSATDQVLGEIKEAETIGELILSQTKECCNRDR